jgi:hypothetical protein
MTHIRVGNKQKKVDISLPKLDDFVHKTYIHVARRIYKNVYLFEMGIDSLTQQKYNREVELIVQESILATVRDSIPKEQIIRAFMDESLEQDEEVFIEAVPPPAPAASLSPTDSSSAEQEKKKLEELETKFPQEVIPEMVPSIVNVDDKIPTTRITFNDFDTMMSTDNKEETKYKPKTIENLEKLSLESAMARNQSQEEDDRLKLSTETLSIADLGIMDIGDGGGTATPASTPPNSNDLISLLDIEEI